MTISEEPHIVVYHTQEARRDTLTRPLKCVRDDAWLGAGYYFWVEEMFAAYWGEDTKCNSGSRQYAIYKGAVREDKLLNATFNEDHYSLFVSSIEKARKKLAKLGLEIELQEVHRLMTDGVWEPGGIAGIIYDDLPTNRRDGTRTYSDIVPLYYRKRIQLVLFELGQLRNFTLYKDRQT